jgi:CRP-like cAMP-binding protein
MCDNAQSIKYNGFNISEGFWKIWGGAMHARLNELLQQLPDYDYERLQPHLKLVSLVEGDHLYEPGDKIDQIYFPTTALVAIAIVLENGSSIDTAIIGSDGLLGLRGIDEGTSVHRFQVSLSGMAYQISRSHLLRESQHGPDIYRMCTQAGIQMIRKMSSEVACANFHTIDQRLAKWILIRHNQDRFSSIQASHQTIADSLGVRREAVTNAMPKLRGISHSRCRISVEDYSLLKQHCCECYSIQREIHPFQMSFQFWHHYLSTDLGECQRGELVCVVTIASAQLSELKHLATQNTETQGRWQESVFHPQLCGNASSQDAHLHSQWALRS